MLTNKKYKISDLKADKDLLKKIKILSRKVTCEQLKIFDEDTIIICLYGTKVVGVCCISMKSPETHFDNEEVEVPYLYNYMCDITYKKMRPSLSIMCYIKTCLKLGGNRFINLDVLDDNAHAMQFFEKNNFVKAGEYNQSIKQYIMYTCDIGEL